MPDKLVLEYLIHGRPAAVLNARQKHRNAAVLTLPEALCLAVDLVAQLLRSLPHQLYLLHADVAPAVDNVGDRPVGNTRLSGNILDGGHTSSSPYACDTFILL